MRMVLGVLGAVCESCGRDGWDEGLVLGEDCLGPEEGMSLGKYYRSFRTR